MTLIKYKRRKTTTRIILHDSHTDPDIGSSEEVPRWKALARDGALRMGLLDTGYHYIIERDGFCGAGREVGLIGTHTPGHNMDSIGVCLVGGRERDGSPDNNFTSRQWRSLFLLIAHLKVLYGDLELVGHSEIQKYRNKALPDCPPVDMDDVRQELALYEHNRRLTDADA